MNEPRTVPVMPAKGSQATRGPGARRFAGVFRPYSLAMPGTTKDSWVGFMMSMVTATAITSSRAT